MRFKYGGRIALKKIQRILEVQNVEKMALRRDVVEAATGLNGLEKITKVYFLNQHYLPLPPPKHSAYSVEFRTQLLLILNRKCAFCSPKSTYKDRIFFVVRSRSGPVHLDIGSSCTGRIKGGRKNFDIAVSPLAISPSFPMQFGLHIIVFCPVLCYAN